MPATFVHSIFDKLNASKEGSNSVYTKGDHAPHEVTQATRAETVSRGCEKPSTLSASEEAMIWSDGTRPLCYSLSCRIPLSLGDATGSSVYRGALFSVSRSPQVDV